MLTSGRECGAPGRGSVVARRAVWPPARNTDGQRSDYWAAQSEVLAVLPELKAPMLSLGKANTRRLANSRKGDD